jgi:hypothetical protein
MHWIGDAAAGAGGAGDDNGDGDDDDNSMRIDWRSAPCDTCGVCVGVCVMTWHRWRVSHHVSQEGHGHALDR